MSSSDVSAGTNRLTAPSWPLFGSVAVTSIALLLAVLNALDPNSVSEPQLLAGYILGSIVAVAFLSFYRSRRNALRANPRFRPQPVLDRVMLMILAVGMAAGIANAVLLAIEIAKQ